MLRECLQYVFLGECRTQESNGFISHNRSLYILTSKKVDVVFFHNNSTLSGNLSSACCHFSKRVCTVDESLCEPSISSIESVSSVHLQRVLTYSRWYLTSLQKLWYQEVTSVCSWPAACRWDSVVGSTLCWSVRWFNCWEIWFWTWWELCIVCHMCISLRIQEITAVCVRTISHKSTLKNSSYVRNENQN